MHAMAPHSFIDPHLLIDPPSYPPPRRGEGRPMHVRARPVRVA